MGITILPDEKERHKPSASSLNCQNFMFEDNKTKATVIRLLKNNSNCNKIMSEVNPPRHLPSKLANRNHSSQEAATTESSFV